MAREDVAHAGRPGPCWGKATGQIEQLAERTTQPFFGCCRTGAEGTTLVNASRASATIRLYRASRYRRNTAA